MANPQTQTEQIKAEAKRLGFLACGVVPATALNRHDAYLRQWLAEGMAGQLQYMTDFFKRQENLLKDFPDLKSILVLAIPYPTETGSETLSTGRIARYAQGRDYHKVTQKKLKQLEAFVRSIFDVAPNKILRCVDTSPILERSLAEAAGIGFFGKNSCLIDPKSGSFFFLSALLTPFDLTPDQPIQWDWGNCTLCLDACPTDALQKPFILDANRCIAYLTIENRGSIDEALRPKIGDWLFECDICQEVCPYNRAKLGPKRAQNDP